MNPTSQLLAQLYDAFAPEYERTRVPRFRPFVKKLLQLYDTRPKSRVLDAGTGTGLAATMVAPRVGHDGRVIGVDISQGQLAIARQKAKNFGFDQCEFRIGNMHSLEFGDDEFDLVICSFATFGEPVELFREFRRVLKLTGVLLCQSWVNVRSGPEGAYDQTLSSFRAHLADAASPLSQLRGALAADAASWSQLAAPADYERVAREAGLAHARAQIETQPIHFDNAEAYIQWRAAGSITRAEIEAMDEAARSQFTREVLEAVRAFETDEGLEFAWSAIQLLARKSSP